MDAVFLVSPPASMLQTYSHSNNNCYLLHERWVGFFLSRRNFVQIYAMTNCASESGTILEQINKDVTKSLFLT